MTTGPNMGTSVNHVARSASNSYFGADEKLRCLLRFGWSQGSNGTITNGTFDEYWYDALGRRVLVRSLREGLCQGSPNGCESTVERTVWAGDQVLYEIRAPGGSNDNLDGAPPISHRQYGVVGYTHAGGIDQPLTVIRAGHPAGLTTSRTPTTCIVRAPRAGARCWSARPRAVWGGGSGFVFRSLWFVPGALSSGRRLMSGGNDTRAVRLH
jgi:hypothetical protein